MSNKIAKSLDREIANESWDEMVLVGFVARTHGIRGQVILNSETDFPGERFREGATLYARLGQGEIETLHVETARFQNGRPVLGLQGITSIDEAERVVGAELRVPASEQRNLPEGTYYHHELIGCAVVTPEGHTVGRVTEVQGQGDATRLVVQGARGEVLIPLAQEICTVDIAAKKILVTPPDGLLEVNGDWR